MLRRYFFAYFLPGNLLSVINSLTFYPIPLYFTYISYQSRLFCLVDALNSICTFPLYITTYFLSITTFHIDRPDHTHRNSLLVAKCESLQSAKIQLSPCINAISQLSPLQSASLRDNIT